MPVEINPGLWRDPKPWRHQVVGVKLAVQNPAFYIGDVPRIGKSRIVIDAACTLHDAGLIDLVLIIGPIAARGVWGDPVLGQISRYAWRASWVYQFHTNSRELWSNNLPAMRWIITNYDIIRTPERLLQLISNFKKVLLVLDESSAVGNHTSQQARAVAKIRERCVRCLMLNGTPGEPPKLWSQFNILNNCLAKKYKTFTSFKWRYSTFSKEGKTIIARRTKAGAKGGLKVVHDWLGWKDLDKLSKILAPYSIRREKRDCPELRDIPVLYDFKEVELSKPTWKMYRELKRDALIALEGGEEYVTPNAGVKLLRLSQICSGHLGGFSEEEPVRTFSQEKVEWLAKYLLNESTAQNVIVWTRWVREREMAAMSFSRFMTIYELYGGQPRAERRDAETILSDGAVRSGRIAMIAQPGAGGMCLDMSAASDVFRLSNDYNLKNWEQSNDRPLGQAQLAKSVNCTDILAVGPNGERTMDHIILEALREKRNIARMTCAEWRRALDE